MKPIDWTVFDKYPENTCECHCGTTFRSHSKAVILDDGSMGLFARKPCPNCGKNNEMRAVRSDPGDDDDS